MPAAHTPPQATDAPLLWLGDRVIELGPQQPLVMGIVNATPDSFSDGGRHQDLEARVALAHALRDAGAAIIDVGGESGVTHLPAVEAEEEIARVVPLVERLTRDGILVSVDTWKASVADAALAAGAMMINDVSGLRDHAMAGVCARAGASLVVTHTRAAPKHKAYPHYEDVVADVLAFLSERLEAAVAAGVRRKRLVVDPGIDLAKTPAQSVELVRRLAEVRALGRPILLATSRKDFIGAITHRPPRRRLAGTLAAIAAGLDGGAALLRVHDVGAVADYLSVRAALTGARPVAEGLRLEEALRREPVST